MLIGCVATLSAIAITLATASFAVSVWQASVRWWEFREKRRARIAVDPGEIRAEPGYWEVELWLTNVGLSHARRVRIWLQDETGTPLCEEHRLSHPLMSGGASEAVRLRLPRDGRLNVTARPVRMWRDSRDGPLQRDVSEQRITLP